MRPRRLRPYRQGRLDGLCGVYAIINALRALCPELGEQAAWELFRHLLRSLGDLLERPWPVVWGGMGQAVVRALLRRACAQVERRTGACLQVRRLRVPGGEVSLSGVWAALREELDQGRVAIVGLSGRWDHWTVAGRATGRTVRLLDSSGLVLLRRSACTVGQARQRYRLTPNSILVVKRADRSLKAG